MCERQFSVIEVHVARFQVHGHDAAQVGRFRRYLLPNHAMMVNEDESFICEQQFDFERGGQRANDLPPIGCMP